MKLMIFGAGYSGQAIAQVMARAARHITGTTRDIQNTAILEHVGIEAFIFDGTVISPSLAQKLKSVTHLVQSIAPGQDGDPLLNIATGHFHNIFPSLQWISYLSTVGVYGDHKGKWIDETALCKPKSERSRQRLAAEEAWLKLGHKLELPVAVLRLSGIYGPGRNAFHKIKNGTARRVYKQNQVFNRIRVEDIGHATAFLAENGIAGIFNVTDCLPSPPQDVITEAARLMGVTPPPEITFDEAELSPMARSFWGENKRVKNEKLRSLGYKFAFPDYRQSLKQMWDMKSI